MNMLPIVTPLSFICPLSNEVVMKDPVCTVDGHTYERANIEVRDTHCNALPL